MNKQGIWYHWELNQYRDMEGDPSANKFRIRGLTHPDYIIWQRKLITTIGASEEIGLNYDKEEHTEMLARSMGGPLWLQEAIYLEIISTLI